MRCQTSPQQNIKSGAVCESMGGPRRGMEKTHISTVACHNIDLESASTFSRGRVPESEPNFLLRFSFCRRILRANHGWLHASPASRAPVRCGEYLARISWERGEITQRR
jgi:hypothetical protein